MNAVLAARQATQPKHWGKMMKEDVENDSEKSVAGARNRSAVLNNDSSCISFRYSFENWILPTRLSLDAAHVSRLVTAVLPVTQAHSAVTYSHGLIKPFCEGAALLFEWWLHCFC